MDGIKDGKKDIHRNHRQRMYEKMKYTPDTLEEHELLEMALYSAIPRRNTNEIAHRLIERFGSFSAVFDADTDELMKVGGIGIASASAIRMIPLLWQRYEADKYAKKQRFADIDEIGRYLVDKYRGRTRETVMLLMLDNKSQATDCRIIGEGSVISSDINPRRIVEIALSCNAAAIVLAHNHPNGVVEPSDEDITVTRLMRRACATIELNMIEHFVIAEEEYLPILTWLSKQPVER